MLFNVLYPLNKFITATSIWGNILQTFAEAPDVVANTSTIAIAEITSTSLSLVANATATALIAYRTLYVFDISFPLSSLNSMPFTRQYRQFKKQMTEAGESKAEQIMILLVESGSIYFVIQVCAYIIRYSSGL